MEKTLSGETFNEFECNHFIHQVYEGIVRQVFVCVCLTAPKLLSCHKKKSNIKDVKKCLFIHFTI